jgi:hypothetical protein
MRFTQAGGSGESGWSADAVMTQVPSQAIATSRNRSRAKRRIDMQAVSILLGALQFPTRSDVRNLEKWSTGDG